jgi:hypothetical protein
LSESAWLAATQRFQLVPCPLKYIKQEDRPPPAYATAVFQATFACPVLSYARVTQAPGTVVKLYYRRGGRVVDGSGLENRHT